MTDSIKSHPNGHRHDDAAQMRADDAQQPPRIVINMKTLRSNPPPVPQPSERPSHKIKRGL